MLDTLGLPDLDVDPVLDGMFDYIHLFVTTRSEITRQFPIAMAHLPPTGKLWLSWTTGRRLGSDLTLPVVIKIGYDAGLVESTCLSIDDTWSGLRFTHPRPGTVYANSFGTLPGLQSAHGDRIDDRDGG